MKAKTLLISHDLKHTANEGDAAICIQGNKQGERIMVNMDWSFDRSWSETEIKSMLGGFLGSIEDVFGEKMVTEAISHYAEDTGKLVKAPGGKMAYLKSRGLNWKEVKNNE